MGTIIDSIIKFLIGVANFICGMPLLYSTAAVALILAITMKGFHFRYFFHSLKEVVKSMVSKKEKSTKGISSFAACCTALGNTLGVGNITGISIALAFGGPGALFWIWVAGFLGVIIKYSEATLASYCHGIDPDTGLYRGGIMWYIEQGMGKKWTWLAFVFALLYCCAGPLTPALQINSVVGAFEGAIEFPPIIIGIVSALLMGFVLIGGIRRLSDMANKVIPAAAIIYFVVSIVVIVVNGRQLPGILKDVFECAFTGSAPAGGFAGATAMMAIRHGITRGFYSNGAAAGDAAFAHSVADVAHPAHQGLWGMFEVTVDTIVCTCTALVVLSTGVLDTGLNGTALTAAAFASFFHNNQVTAIFLGAVIAIFAFTTAVVTSYYAEVCLRYVIKNRKIAQKAAYVYRCLLCLSAAVGSVSALETLWGFNDIALALCMFICMFALIMCRKIVARLTKEYVSTIKKGKKKHDGPKQNENDMENTQGVIP